MEPTGASQEQVVADILREFGVVEDARGPFEPTWERVAERVLPFYATSFSSQGNTSPGKLQGLEQYDTTAGAALWKFGAAMESFLTPASGKWHRMRPIDAILKRNRGAMAWYDHVTEMLFHYRYSPHAGFQSNKHDGYISIGAFGTGCLFTDQFKDPTLPGAKGLRYRNIPLGELFFSVNHQGQVDKVYRRFKMTLRQIAQKWGQDAMPSDLRDRLKTKPEDEVTVIHRVCPNAEYEPGRLDAKGKRFSSHYVLRDQKVLMESGGYRSMPYSVARYLTAPGELYGRSPAMNVLPNINVLNVEKRTILKQGERTVDPVLLTFDDGILDGFSLKPGALNAGGVNADGRPLVHALPVGNLAVGKELMDDERLAINDAFLVTLFQILVETPQMTATEVLERAREKGALLSPTMGRHQSEGLGPQIEREFDLLMWQGLIEPPPQIVIDAGAEYQVEYDAPLNRAMRAEEASGIMRSMQWSAEVAAQTMDPSAMDWYDVDTITPDIADINGAPFKYIRTPEAVAEIRKGRQADKAAQQLTQALPGMAAMAKVASPEGTSPNPGQGA